MPKKKYCIKLNDSEIQQLEKIIKTGASVGRNTKQKGTDWQFITDDERIKLKKLYPTIQE